MLSNSAIISISSGQLAAIFPTVFDNKINDMGAAFDPNMAKWSVAICFLLEHVIGAVVLIIWYVIPSIPETISNNLKREAYIAMKNANDKKDESVSNSKAAKSRKLLRMSSAGGCFSKCDITHVPTYSDLNNSYGEKVDLVSWFARNSKPVGTYAGVKKKPAGMCSETVKDIFAQNSNDTKNSSNATPYYRMSMYVPSLNK